MSQTPPPPALRRSVFEVIEPGVRDFAGSRAFARASVLAIIASVACAIFGTLPGGGMWRGVIDTGETLFDVLFVAEYALRLWTAPEMPHLSKVGPVRAAARHATSAQMVLDAIGLLPILVALLAPGATGLILILQVFRFFRLARYSSGLSTVGRVLVSEARALSGTAMIGLSMLLLSATTMYLLEHEAQPDRFGSVPQAMYWAIVTLATVGYGDVVPITAAGKVAAGIVIVSGLIFFALPIAIIATSFQSEVRRRDFNVSYAMVARVPLFAALDGIEIAELAGMLKSRRVPRDAVIVRRGDEGDCMFFIARGQVEVIVPGGVVTLREGAFFGEIAVLGRTTRTATVVARRPCDLLVLDAGDLVRLTSRNPHLREVLEEAIAARTGAAS